MEFRILGPLEVVDDAGRPLQLGGARQRALLAALLLHANEVVLLDRLMDELWGEQPPATGAKALQVAISQLRKALGNGALETRPAGYLLQVAPEQLDLGRFERLREEARASLAAGSAERAAAALREALALWRGPALADVATEPFARGEAERLEELRLVALEERIEADLELGRHAELVPELESLVRKYLLRERLRRHLMLALYRAGRQAEALELYRETRRMLAEELGIDPSSELQELERAILRHDPELEPVPVPSARSSPARVAARRRRPLLLVAAVLAAGLALGLVLAFQGGPEALAGVSPDTVAVIDPGRNALVAEVPVGSSPGPIAAAAGRLWVLNRNSRTITAVDPAARRAVGTWGAGEAPRSLAAGRVLAVLDGHAHRLHIFDLPALVSFSSADIEGGTSLPGDDIAADGFELWFTQMLPPTLLLIVPPSLTAPPIRIPLPAAPTAVAYGADTAWATLADGRLAVVDPLRRAIVGTVRVGRGPADVAVGGGAAWVANGRDGTVSRVRVKSRAVTATIPVGRDPAALAVGAGAVWVANRRDGTVSRIDPAANRVVATIRVGHRPEGIAVAGGLVWVTVRT